MTEADPWLTVQDVARRLKLNPETIRRWLRSGRLRGTLVSRGRGGYRVRESEVRRIESEGIGDAEQAHQ